MSITGPRVILAWPKAKFMDLSSMARYNDDMDTIIGQLHQLFSNELTIFIASMLPVLELRGAIPVGISFGLEPLYVLLLSLAGSMLPAPVLFFAIRQVFRMLMKQPFFDKHLNMLMDRTLARSDRIKRYEFWGLVLFVAVPLPGTGIWTGTLAAVLLDFRFKRAMPALFIGDLAAGLLITAISMGVFSFICG